MKYSDKLGGSYRIDDLPGNSQIAVSNAAFIHPNQRGKGHGKKVHKEKLNLMIELGYDIALCTVVTSNEPQIRIVEKNGWEKLMQFKSKKTGNDIILFGKYLEDEQIRAGIQTKG